MSAVPPVIAAEGREWVVGRAWPAPDGVTDLELTAPGAPGVRAARWLDGRAVLEAPGSDARLPGLASIARGGAVVSWRRGRRAVVRESASGSFVKIVRPHAGPAVSRAHTEAHAFRRGFTVPEPMASAPGDDAGVVRLSRVEGRTLCDLGADESLSDALVARAWEAWADGWLRVLGSSIAGMPRHDAHDEARVLRSWANAAAPVADDAAALTAYAEAVAARLEQGSVLELVVAHRDLHDKQVLFAGGTGAGLIDLDTAAAAEPALDLANLRVHVAWREAQSRLRRRRADAARAAIDRVVAAAGVLPTRMSAYEDATRVRLGAVYLFRPLWRETARAWLQAVLPGQTSR